MVTKQRLKNYGNGSAVRDVTYLVNFIVEHCKPFLLKLFTICLLFFFSMHFSQVVEQTRDLKIDRTKSTIKTRFNAPIGYVWEPVKNGTFEEYLVNFPLHPDRYPIQDFTGAPIRDQSKHAAVLKVDVGTQDLQQCADAWIRLYAEYLWLNNHKQNIAFEFTSGQKCSWQAYKNGLRTIEKGDKVKFIETAKKDDSYKNFRDYLDLIFQYAGTISLDRESILVPTNQDIQVGDFLINPGSPGHLVFIVGIAKNQWGKRVYLLAESYMPAQSVHILKNPFDKKISPWYELDVNSARSFTAKYIFPKNAIKRFKNLDKYQNQMP